MKHKSFPFFLLVFLTLTVCATQIYASDTPDPLSVTIAGSLQSELGCSEDWQPACTSTYLMDDPEDDVWQQTFNIPAGNWEYKAALNNSWDENYGANAQRNGANIALNLADPTSVKFYYDHKTHWITSNANSAIAVAPGSFQSELGCSGDWDPSCLRSWLQDPDGDNIFTFTTRGLPAGNYEVKVAHNESWTENYGQGGVPNGPNIPFTVSSDCEATLFSYDLATHILTIGPAAPPAQPTSVTVAGSLQSELGCPGDWMPDCATTHLTFDAADAVWQGTFNVPAGNWEYKAPINDSWDENYGQNAQRDGPNIPLNLGAPTDVKFYYDHSTHWITDNVNKVIAVAPGSFQSELGCPGDWDPSCLRSWLQDPNGDGFYSFSARLPAGDYEVKVAHNESWDENYGEGGVPNGPNIPFTVPVSCTEIFFNYDPNTHILTVGAEGGPRGNLSKAQAHWLLENTIVWNPAGFQPDWTVTLHHDPDGNLVLGEDGVSGGTAIPLTYDPSGLDPATAEKFPHLSGYKVFRIADENLAAVPDALKNQVAVSAKDGDELMDATSIQTPGVLDDLYTYTGPLGITFAGSQPTIRVWAPTARFVNFHLFPDSNPATPAEAVIPMTLDFSTGVWSVVGNSGWKNKFYAFEVQVWVRITGNVETNLVTDPYSLSLARNSFRSQIVNLNDSSLRPNGWNGLHKPLLKAPEDIVLYELHIRDFSANDNSVPANQRGTFKAFTQSNSNGMKHLKKLAEAGLTHIHLLPSFDIATIHEDKSQWQSPDPAYLATLPPDSDEQQELVMDTADQDGFNWGYDPWHYTVPEGSYSTDPDGSKRILEFRQMVKGLNRAGLRVVMDVVYNHTNSSAQNEKSVLDRIVPGYYHRYNADGNIERSTCCENTASEHNMMEKLMVDSVITWAKHYKVDGFRFDLMGHHMKRNMLKIREALDSLTIQNDGVDGKKVYIYGEAWNFGEVADNARGVNAIQRNMAGTGIGSFNDRIRDGARGGGPFSGIQEQGFLTGLYYDPNATNQGSPQDQLNTLLQRTDWIRTGVAAGLADFSFEDRFGNIVQSSDIDYNGQQAGYTADPQEIINYIEAHDNETLFDAIQLKASLSNEMDQRVRMQNLGMSLTLLSQGVPFLHAGVDLLRSKSLDRNSYNSGDWFNKLDFTYMLNNWGIGLPPQPDNGSNWPIFQPLLANPALQPEHQDILDSVMHLREMLAIRKSSRLFRLQKEELVINHLGFKNTGPSQLPGLLAFTLTDDSGSIDRKFKLIVTLINANDEAQDFSDSDFTGKNLILHPLQQVSADPVVQTSTFDSASATFGIPGRTTSVFVEFRPAEDQINLLIDDVNALVANGTLNHVQGLLLKLSLQQALNHLEHGRESKAINKINAFIITVWTYRLLGILPNDNADALIEAALDAIYTIQQT